MLKNLFKDIDWKHALGEVILIFIGITIAIWFNNWNESKKAKEIELKSLIELKGAIGQDLTDIEENIQGFKGRTVLYQLILEHIENELPLSDELRARFPYMQGITTFLSNIGPYETLKSRGVEIINNDSIRNGISQYYDLEYEKIQTDEQQHKDHYNEYLKPFILEHFDLSGSQFQPINYEDLMKRFEFKQIITWAYRTDSYMLDNYRAIEGKARKLQKDLSKEIKESE